MNNNNNSEITPSQYFDYLKNAKQSITSDTLKSSFEVFIKLGEKYSTLGQAESLKKLCFLADVLKREEQLIDLGITTFIYKDAIEDYIENVASKAVKIIELSRYTREVPDELVTVVEKVKPIFDEFYVVFTDYTGKEERKINKERRDKDPILFGVFKSNGNISDRFYFLGDWVDEYCDLTLDKMISEYKDNKGYTPTITETIPSNSDELIDILKSLGNSTNTTQTYELSDDSSTGRKLLVPSYSYIVDNQKPLKKRFFDKIRTFFNFGTKC